MASTPVETICACATRTGVSSIGNTTSVAGRDPFKLPSGERVGLGKVGHWLVHGGRYQEKTSAEVKECERGNEECRTRSRVALYTKAWRTCEN